MNGMAATAIFGILILAIGSAWVMTGGLSPAAGIPGPADPPPASPVTTAAPLPAATTAAPVPPGTPLPEPARLEAAAPVPAETLVSAGRARDHFLAIACSRNNRLERLDSVAGQKPLRISLVAPDRYDPAFIAETVQEFNGLSRTVQIYDKITEGRQGDIVLIFLPESGLPSVNAGPDFTYQGRVVAKGGQYISSGIKGDVRNHTIARSLYYRLGVTGESASYPDSLFYAGDNTNTRLNSADRMAIATLYGPALSHGMTLEDLRKIVYIPDKRG